MLKWAVNGLRQNGLQKEDNNLQFPTKSDLSIFRPKTSWIDTENQCTSTPLKASIPNLLKYPSDKVGGLTDLSSIVPELPNNSPLMWHANKETVQPLKSAESSNIYSNFPNNYPSTLPPFDVKYLPSALVPGHMLALRGIGIPDSYFNKPMHIPPHFQDVLLNVNEDTLLETKMLENRAESIAKYPPHMEESTISSTKMGDVTLERMIDEILESNRKPQKYLHQQKPYSMSPTYTPAEDPASDLQEVWDSETACPRQRKQKLRARLTKKMLFGVKEICSSPLHENSDLGHLRRQRCLRRKRKINQITSNVLSSAQRVLAKGRQIKPHKMHSNGLLIHGEMHSQKQLPNLSPDSGHNSSSDYDESGTGITLHQCIEDDYKTLDNTKRKLSFNKTCF